MSTPRDGTPKPAVWPRLPAHAPGLRIGLYGGSFNPPHAAHRRLALEALKRLDLDQVWWLVSPGNPLKDNGNLAPLADRVRAARALAAHPRIRVTPIEADLGTRYTLDTLQRLRQRAPGLRFVWLMGADNLATFHRWQGWREIAAMMPLAIFDRPGSSFTPLSAKAAIHLGAHRLPEIEARRLATEKPPAWVFLHQPRSPLSSTSLRRDVLKPPSDPP